MASDPEIYESAVVYLKGAIFQDATAITISYEDSDKPVFLNDGKILIAPGERIMRIGIDNAISQNSIAHDLVRQYLEVAELQFAVQLLTNGKRLATTGYLTAPGYSFAVAQNASFKTGFVGKAAYFK